jgi:hypothetical protein
VTFRNLILSGGISHPFAQTSAIAAKQLATLGIHSEVLPLREGLARLGESRFDLLTVNALAFSMTQHEKYAAQREAYAFSINEAEKDAIRSHLAAGGKLLGLHTAAICFDDWPEWQAHLGISWQWGRSSHPPPCRVQVQATPEFETVDELYCGMSLHPDATVLATATCADVSTPQPVLLQHANAAYLALGHDEAAVSHPGYTRLLTEAVKLLLAPSKERTNAVD